MTDFYILRNVAEHSQIDRSVSRSSSALNLSLVGLRHPRDGEAIGAIPRRTGG
jgi:hypothetical protein